MTISNTTCTITVNREPVLHPGPKLSDLGLETLSPYFLIYRIAEACSVIVVAAGSVADVQAAHRVSENYRFRVHAIPL